MREPSCSGLDGLAGRLGRRRESGRLRFLRQTSRSRSASRWRGGPESQLGEEWRRAPRVEREDEVPGGARERHIGEAPLLLERAVDITGIDERSAVRDPVFLEPEHHDGLPLASLRGVDGGQLDRRIRVSKGRDPGSCGVVGSQEGGDVREAGRPAERTSASRQA